jgi:hypothetical protein
VLVLQVNSIYIGKEELMTELQIKINDLLQEIEDGEVRIETLKSINKDKKKQIAKLLKLQDELNVALL